MKHFPQPVIPVILYRRKLSQFWLIFVQVSAWSKRFKSESYFQTFLLSLFLLTLSWSSFSSWKHRLWRMRGNFSCIFFFQKPENRKYKFAKFCDVKPRRAFWKIDSCSTKVSWLVLERRMRDKEMYQRLKI